MRGRIRVGPGVLHCRYCGVLVSEFAMDEVVDRSMDAFRLMRPPVATELWIEDGKLSGTLNA
jgi:hypothetical protein